MKKLILLLTLLLVQPVLGQVYISEIMYNPYPISDTDAEWVELYNSGPESVSLNDWTLNGAEFDDVTIQSNQFLVIARELTDGTDEDLDSFETIYGNGDGVWNDGFTAIDGSISLTDGEGAMLANSDSAQDIVNYSKSWGGDGNGFSIRKKDLVGENTPDNWAEHKLIGGTPGSGEGSSLEVSFFVESSLLKISKLSFPDDTPAEGFQVIPTPGGVRNLTFEVIVEDAQNPSGSILFLNEEITLNVEGPLLSGNILLPYSVQPGGYNISYHLEDGPKTLDGSLNFEVMPLIALQASTNALSFGLILQNSTSAPQDVTLSNLGNVIIDTRLLASNFSSNSTVLNPSVISVNSGGIITALDYITEVELDLEPGTNKAVSFTASVPSDAVKANTLVQ